MNYNRSTQTYDQPNLFVERETNSGYQSLLTPEYQKFKTTDLRIEMYKWQCLNYGPF